MKHAIRIMVPGLLASQFLDFLHAGSLSGGEDFTVFINQGITGHGAGVILC